MAQQFVLTLTCPEGPGIVHAVTSVLVEHGCDITEHQQFDDPVHGLLFLRSDPAFERLHASPRWKPFVHRVFDDAGSRLPAVAPPPRA